MKRKIFGRLIGMALAGAMMVSAVPAFADEYIVEDTETAEEEILTDSAQDAEEQDGDLYDGALIEDMDVAEHKNAYDEGNLWYSTSFGSFSNGSGSVAYIHEYPSEIGGWDEIPTPADGSKTFLGYSLTDGGEVVEPPFQFEKAGTILYAVWGSNVEYTITLDANGGKFLDAATSKNFKYKDGTVLNMAYELEEGELPVAVDGPGDFLGYSATQGGSVLTSYKVTGNATLYAVWEDYADCEHVWVRDEASSVPASCTEAGKDVYVCSKCNAFEERPVQATGHSFGEWTITKQATAQEEGEEERVCSACGAKETQAIPKVQEPDPQGPSDPGTENPSQGGSSSQPAPSSGTQQAVKARTLTGPKAVAKGKSISLKLVNATGKITWKSSNKKVATVSAGGAVKGKKKGKATISATENGKTYKFTVSVIDPKLNKKSAKIKVKKSVKLKVKNAKGAAVTWKSSNPAVATVSASGKVTALKKGSAKITASVGGKTLTCKIKVKK